MQNSSSFTSYEVNQDSFIIFTRFVVTGQHYEHTNIDGRLDLIDMERKRRQARIWVKECNV